MTDASRPSIPPEQEIAIQAARSGENLFITGSAGTGKSNLEHLIMTDAEENGLRTVLAAPTGIAAEAIGGCTIHRLLGLSGPLVEVDDAGKVSGHSDRIQSWAGASGALISGVKHPPLLSPTHQGTCSTSKKTGCF